MEGGSSFQYWGPRTEKELPALVLVNGTFSLRVSIADLMPLLSEKPPILMCDLIKGMLWKCTIVVFAATSYVVYKAGNCNAQTLDCNVTYGSSCYIFNCLSGYSPWVRHNDTCVGSGGHLASFESEEEFKFVEKRFKFQILNSFCHDYFIGLKRDSNKPIEEQNSWTWTTGKIRDPMDWFMWGENEPNVRVQYAAGVYLDVTLNNRTIFDVNMIRRAHTRLTGSICEIQFTIDDIPEVTNIPLSLEPDVIFSTSTDNILKEDGPFELVASLTVLPENTHLKTGNGELLPSASDIVNIDIYDKNGSKISINSVIIFPSLKIAKTGNNASFNQFPECHYTQSKNTTATWLIDGCNTLYHDDDDYWSNVKCICTHLTSFVILMKPKPIKENKFLSVLTKFGVTISSVFLLITLVIICNFKNLRNSDRYRILRHLVIALLCVNLFFSFLEFDFKHTTITCSLLAGCLHYSLLAAFSWMLIMSTDLYMKIKHPFADHERLFVYSRYIAWIGPIIIVGTTAGITRDNYASDKCWLNTSSLAIWAFIVPVCVVMLTVVVQLVIIGYIAYTKSQLPNYTEEEKQKLERIRILIPAVGLTWIFGVIIVFCDWKIMEYIFVILNSMQGFLIWISQCVISKEVREEIKKRFSNHVSDIH
ncbi:adhesion G protein-coupled receptor L3-like [Anneissia japonica]|uniref:adhesion G protein-coupled receptor L3-like n=1 Tax=Anneissia japonica TaxID=1529436 RepID=UPI001425BA1D|nr:adhesion G protein-coupled receptor L3-like [Anneissia japonica]